MNSVTRKKNKRRSKLLIRLDKTGRVGGRARGERKAADNGPADFMASIVRCMFVDWRLCKYVPDFPGFDLV